MLRTEALVRDLAAAGRPVLGICFGHQLIAQALGGEVKRNPLGREMGTMRVQRLADDPLFAGLPATFDIQGTHADAVTRLPPGAEVLATTPRDAFAAFRVGGHVRGVQFHPEFDADVMRGYLHERREIVLQEGGDPDALLAAVHDETPGASILRNFVKALSPTPSS
jgi:GMP synthase (glutamine-hydrolysing)